MAISEIDLLALNELINQDSQVLEHKPISSLTINKSYIIKKMLPVNTRFGKSIVMHLFEESTITTFKSFLPKRVVDNLSEDIIDQINSSNGKYTFTYLGQRVPAYVGAMPSSIVRFDLSA